MSAVISLETPRLPPNASPDVDLDVDSLHILSRAPRLHHIEEDGQPDYSTGDESKKLSTRIARIEAERGDLLTLTHATIDAEDSKEADGDRTKEGRRPSPEELWQLKTEVYNKLDFTRHGLLEGLNLLNHILPPVTHPTGSSEPPTELTFPPDTLAATVLDLPLVTKTADERLKDASLALARTRETIRSASDRLKEASNLLQASVQSSNKNWSTWLDWADRGRVECRGAEPHAHFRDASGMQRAAKEVVTFFGYEEAAEGFRRSSYAGLDDRGELVLPPRRRGRRRLVLRLRASADHDEETLAPSRPDPNGDTLLEARDEVFDEELFSVIAKESRQIATSSSDDSLTVPLPNGGQLQLMMTSIDNLPPDTSSSSTVALVGAYLRLRLVAVYRARRQTLDPRTASLPGPRTLPAIPAVIEPTLALISLYLRATRLLSSFRAISALLPEGDATVDFSPVDWDLTASSPRAGAVVSLRLPAGATVHARLESGAASVPLDLSGGRRAHPANRNLLQPAVDFEVRGAYALEFARRLGEDWTADRLLGRCENGKHRLQVFFDLSRGLDCEVAGKRFQQDGSGRSVYEWVVTATAS